VIEITGAMQWVKSQISAIYLSVMPQSQTRQIQIVAVNTLK
jgi:hypothetical protein